MGLFSKSTTPNSNGEQAIATYKVVYKGGHPDYPKSKVSGIDFLLFADRFELRPTMGSKSWFSAIAIPYATVTDFKIVQRQVGSAEGIIGGLNSRQLNQPNNIHITYAANTQTIVLRLEMLTGVTVMGQAKKCLELEDRLNVHGIRQKFQQPKTTLSNDMATQLDRLVQLHHNGILTDAEFSSAKRKLLG